jgi:hypothetical protein
MTTAEEMHAAWPAPAVSDALRAMRLRLFSTGYTALLRLRRVRP